MIFFLASSLLLSMSTDVTLYTLEPVGIQFYHLPAEVLPIMEGTLTEESGAVYGSPGSEGIVFSCHYWRMDQPINNTDLWIREKITSVLPPDFHETLNKSTPTWVEGSVATEARDARSLGLMSMINFTFTVNGGMGRGRSYGIFRNGYATLLTIYGPSPLNPQELLEQTVATATLR